MSTIYHLDDDGRPTSYDCLYHCAPGSPALCDRQWCRCQCHQPMPDNDDEREPRPGVGGFGPRPATLAGSGGTDPDRARALDKLRRST